MNYLDPTLHCDVDCLTPTPCVHVQGIIMRKEALEEFSAVEQAFLRVRCVQLLFHLRVPVLRVFRASPDPRLIFTFRMQRSLNLLLWADTPQRDASAAPWASSG